MSFQKPTVEEVQAYCEERNNGVDPEVFWHFYNGKGWKVGKSPMVSWQSCVFTWEKNNRNKKTSNSLPIPTYIPPPEPTEEDRAEIDRLLEQNGGFFGAMRNKTEEK